MWFWASAKVFAIAWLVSYAFLAPAPTFDALGVLLWVAMPVAVCGGLVALVGLFWSTRDATGRALSLELSGLCVLIVGPLVHASTMVWIMVLGLDNGEGARVPAGLLSLTLACCLAAHAFDVAHRRRPVIGGGR